MTRRAFITGISGQDGAYLAKLLLDKSYTVIGGVHAGARSNLGRLEELGIAGEIETVAIDLRQVDDLRRAVERANADEVYNLAGQSYVGRSFERPVYTGAVNGIGVTAILEAVRTLGPAARFYQASTSELFGQVEQSPQNERTPFHPRSPYAAAKAYAHWITVNYRESYRLHAVCGILFNHELPLRGQEFVTRKITLGLASIRHRQAEVLELGNLNARRDWGYAGDYVDGMWRMLQRSPADDYVLATGQTRSIRDFVTEAGLHLGFDIIWQGTGVDEMGLDRKSGRIVVRVDPRLFRPAEVEAVCGDAGKAARELDWRPVTGFAETVRLMAQADDRRVRDGTVRF